MVLHGVIDLMQTFKNEVTFEVFNTSIISFSQSNRLGHTVNTEMQIHILIASMRIYLLIG